MIHGKNMKLKNCRKCLYSSNVPRYLKDLLYFYFLQHLLYFNWLFEILIHSSSLISWLFFAYALSDAWNINFQTNSMNASFTFVASFTDVSKREILSLLQDFVRYYHELLFDLSDYIIIHHHTSSYIFISSIRFWSEL
jgi:hypothetical protein